MIDISLGNLKNWLSGSVVDRERQELRASWAETERLWQASPFAKTKLTRLVVDIVQAAADAAGREPALPVFISACMVVDTLLRAEDVIALEAEWPVIENDPSVAAAVRTMLARRKRWSASFDHMFGIFAGRCRTVLTDIFKNLPEACFGTWQSDDDFFSVPLFDMVETPAFFVQSLVLLPYDDDALRFEVFWRLRDQLATNLLIASGFSPTDNIHERRDRLKMPVLQPKLPANELTRLYLSGTPFYDFAQVLVPFHIPDEARFEHCHIVGGTGHGKTQLMQRMIHYDLVAAQKEHRSVVVIDSQGDLINKLMRLDLFDPDTPESLADKLIIVDPADVEFPFSLNLFDSHLDRVAFYAPADRERVLNGVIELYEVFFGSMLGAELTQKQGVIFRYLARLMLTIPSANIHTLMQLMEDGKAFKPYMDKLDGSARHFFQSEFFHPSFAATKKQILKRLWGVLSTPAFERMFAQNENKLDLFEALNAGKIILISTAKDLLKSDGSALFGRFFIALLAQATLERSTLKPDARMPTYVYVDEAQEYFDDSIETILSQARKYRVGLTLAHQTLDQLSPRLRAAILANTSFKCAGGVSSRDARVLADELRTDTDFIEGMKRHTDRSEFAVWLKHQTPRAIRLSVPLGFLERQAVQSEEGFAEVMQANRARYCCPLANLPRFDSSPEQSPDTDTGDHAPSPSPEYAPASTSLSTPYQKPTRPTIDRELGKGGPQHRYVQHVVKGLAEERGFRAVIEAPVPGGQVDIALYHGDLSIACEVSVTSTAEYEARNLAKCLAGGFSQVFAIGNDAKRIRAIEATAKRTLSEGELAKVVFLTLEDVAAALDTLAMPPADSQVVRGYRVKVARSVVSAMEAHDRRASIARVIARSLRNLPTK